MKGAYLAFDAAGDFNCLRFGVVQSLLKDSSPGVVGHILHHLHLLALDWSLKHFEQCQPRPLTGYEDSSY